MSNFFDNPENVKRIFREIADLKIKKAETEAELKTKEAIAFAYMKQTNVDKVETDFGKFSKTFRTYYNFSPEVTKLEEEVKERKADEIATGKATVKSVSMSLRYNSPKE